MWVWLCVGFSVGLIVGVGVGAGLVAGVVVCLTCSVEQPRLFSRQSNLTHWRLKPVIEDTTHTHTHAHVHAQAPVAPPPPPPPPPNPHPSSNAASHGTAHVTALTATTVSAAEYASMLAAQVRKEKW